MALRTPGAASARNSTCTLARKTARGLNMTLKKIRLSKINLANEAIAKKLDARLQQWMKSTGDSWNFDWTHLVEDDGRLYKHKTFYTVDEYLHWAKQNPDLDRKR
jgi:hypothetical protein